MRRPIQDEVRHMIEEATKLPDRPSSRIPAADSRNTRKTHVRHIGAVNSVSDGSSTVIA